MATLNHLFGLQEQICYVQCGYCTTILLVSVPLNSLAMVVNVRCGHCTSLLSVNMLKTSLVPLHLFDELMKQEICPEKDNADGQQKPQNSNTTHSLYMSSDEEDEDVRPVNNIQVINKPPEKRQRAPSAYNQFIKEEIRRLKATYPNMTHKQIFSTAAKNWAHFPLSQRKGDGEQGCQGRNKMPSYSDIEKGPC